VRIGSHTIQFNDALAQFQFEFAFDFSAIGVFIQLVSPWGRDGDSSGADDLSSALQRRLGLPVVASLLSIIISIRNEAKATKTKLISSSFRCRRGLKAGAKKKKDDGGGCYSSVSSDQLWIH